MPKRAIPLISIVLSYIGLPVDPIASNRAPRYAYNTSSLEVLTAESSSESLLLVNFKFVQGDLKLIYSVGYFNLGL